MRPPVIALLRDKPSKHRARRNDSISEMGPQLQQAAGATQTNALACVGSLLGQRRGRWPSSEPAQDAGLSWHPDHAIWSPLFTRPLMTFAVPFAVKCLGYYLRVKGGEIGSGPEHVSVHYGCLQNQLNYHNSDRESGPQSKRDKAPCIIFAGQTRPDSGQIGGLWRSMVRQEIHPISPGGQPWQD